MKIISHVVLCFGGLTLLSVSAGSFKAPEVVVINGLKNAHANTNALKLRPSRFSLSTCSQLSMRQIRGGHNNERRKDGNNASVSIGATKRGGALVTTKSRRFRRSPTYKVAKQLNVISSSVLSDSDKKKDMFTSYSTYNPSSYARTTPKTYQKLFNLDLGLSSLDLAVLFTYACSMITLTAPVVLIPVISGDPSMLTSSTTSPLFSSVTGASFAATVASFSTIGAGVGKILNGFVCQTLGSRRCLTYYLFALSAFTAYFSMATGVEQITWATTGMEFFASIMWTACTVIFATHYERDAERFTKSIAALSLASTGASLTSKFGLTFLLSVMDWRSLAKLVAVISICGTIIVNRFIMDSPKAKVKPQVDQFSLESACESVEAVTKQDLFWKVGLAHAMVFLVRSSDKVLGAFFNQVTDLPRIVCGGLTSSVTIGFAIGAYLNTNKVNSIRDRDEKKGVIKRFYKSAVFSAMTLALCSIPTFQAVLGAIDSSLLPLTIVLASGTMAASVSFQFYNFPATVAKTFGKNKAVCLSFIDAMGFLTCGLVWNLSSRLVGESGILSDFNGLGWTVTWTFLAACLAFGGYTISKIIPLVFGWERVNLKR